MIDRFFFTVITAIMLIVGAVSIVEIEWYWIVAVFVYSQVLNDVFCHRICSHRMFPVNTKSITYKILTWLASADMGNGPVRSVTLTHNLHHIYSDSGPWDVMNWRYYWYSSSILSPILSKNQIPQEVYEKYADKQYKKYSDILNDPWTNFCADYQIAISIITLAICYLISPLLFKIICVGRLLLSISTGIAAIAGHVKNFPLSYRNFDTKDTSSNNIIFHYLFLGLFEGMLQNNHHGRPKSAKPNPRWFEFDTSYPFVVILRQLLKK